MKRVAMFRRGCSGVGSAEGRKLDEAQAAIKDALRLGTEDARTLLSCRDDRSRCR